MTRIEPPPGITDTWQAMTLTVACAVLQETQAWPGIIATMTEDEFETWRASIRIHRDAWRTHLDRVTADAIRDYERQGHAAGWLT